MPQHMQCMHAACTSCECIHELFPVSKCAISLTLSSSSDCGISTNCCLPLHQLLLSFAPDCSLFFLVPFSVFLCTNWIFPSCFSLPLHGLWPLCAATRTRAREQTLLGELSYCRTKRPQSVQRKTKTTRARAREQTVLGELSAKLCCSETSRKMRQLRTPRRRSRSGLCMSTMPSARSMIG